MSEAPEPGILKLTIGKEPWQSKVEFDGKLVRNMLGFKVEQKDANSFPVIELTVIGSELIVEGNLSDTLIRHLCPLCRKELARAGASIEARHESAEREFEEWLASDAPGASDIADRADARTGWMAARGL